MLIIQAFGWLLITAVFLASMYYMVLAIVGLVGRARAPRGELGSYAVHSFAIVIPAHNEEGTIGPILESCASLDYPPDRYTVFVIADNCTDGTAMVAEATGVTCLRRLNPNHRGKGHALSWAFDRILPLGYDAVVVLDADCRIDQHALRVFERCLVDGDQVVQANCVASNPDESPTSYAAAVANTLENDLFCAPKSRLRLAVFLRGTGMVFRRDVLERYPWQADSIAEDGQYTLGLLRAGVRVRYAQSVAVRTESPADRVQMSVQRKRWSGGGSTLAKTHALRLIQEGLIKRQILLVDGGWTLIVQARTLILIALVAALASGVLCTWLAPGSRSDLLLAVGLLLATVHFIYLAIGVALLGMTRRRMALLLGSPAAIMRMLGIALVGVFGSSQETWQRTPRTRT